MAYAGEGERNATGATRIAGSMRVVAALHIAEPRFERSAFTEEYKVFLRLLREARKKKGMTQAELAERLGETQSWVSKCERGERRVDIVELRAFCQALDVPFLSFVEALDTELPDGSS